MKAKVFKQSQVDHCKAVCKTYFEKNNLTVLFDAPIAPNIEWTPNIYAKNGSQYGIDIKTEPHLETFWLETFIKNVRPNNPAMKICLAFPFEIALRLTHETLKTFFENNLAILIVYDSMLEVYGLKPSNVPAYTANSVIKRLKEKQADYLSAQLKGCRKGVRYFSQYEQICLEIFRTLFVPPLAEPRSQLPNLTGARRRDHIFPNHAKKGFWFAEIKKQFSGHYVLIECKNYTHALATDEIDDAAKYLNEHSIGLFSLLLSRTKPNPTAKQLQVDYWKANPRKLIINLIDADLVEMIDKYKHQADPSEVIQKKIDDFMLSI